MSQSQSQSWLSTKLLRGFDTWEIALGTAVTACVAVHSARTEHIAEL